ncbi:DUF6882 domain-containing protein [Nocardia noduli]|uniref:DUF6882 domain-containing protein n=1 Tax=Nocardia noduli TaxID=2815722 RepID=UPI0034D5E1DD
MRTCPGGWARRIGGDLDQRTGLISWTFPDKTATAPAQIIGSHNTRAGTWGCGHVSTRASCPT